jgi:hypothetical protein
MWGELKNKLRNMPSNFLSWLVATGIYFDPSEVFTRLDNSFPLSKYYLRGGKEGKKKAFSFQFLLDKAKNAFIGFCV